VTANSRRFASGGDVVNDQRIGADFIPFAQEKSVCFEESVDGGGMSTLNASSLRIVRLAIWVMYLFSDTAMVRPDKRFTCNMT
jgi:hypothetical protein